MKALIHCLPFPVPAVWPYVLVILLSAGPWASTEQVPADACVTRVALRGADFLKARLSGSAATAVLATDGAETLAWKMPCSSDFT